jgi:oligopeptidase A
MITAFGHLFSGAVAYAAGYYSYLWAAVLDADAFTQFERRGIFDAETGRDFMDAVLARGSSEKPEALYQRFMGREPDPKALLRRQGLLPASPGK